MTQPGETDGLTSRRHVEIIREYSPRFKFRLCPREQSPDHRATGCRSISKNGAEQIGVHGSIDAEPSRVPVIIVDTVISSTAALRSGTIPNASPAVVLDIAARGAPTEEIFISAFGGRVYLWRIFFMTETPTDKKAIELSLDPRCRARHPNAL